MNFADTVADDAVYLEVIPYTVYRYISMLLENYFFIFLFWEKEEEEEMTTTKTKI